MPATSSRYHTAPARERPEHPWSHGAQPRHHASRTRTPAPPGSPTTPSSSSTAARRRRTKDPTAHRSAANGTRESNRPRTPGTSAPIFSADEFDDPDKERRPKKVSPRSTIQSASPVYVRSSSNRRVAVAIEESVDDYTSPSVEVYTEDLADILTVATVDDDGLGDVAPVPSPKRRVYGRGPSIPLASTRDIQSFDNRPLIDPLYNGDPSYDFVEDDYMASFRTMDEQDSDSSSGNAYLPKTLQRERTTSNSNRDNFQTVWNQGAELEHRQRPHQTSQRLSRIPPPPLATTTDSRASLAASTILPSPTSVQYSLLLCDPAYVHAQAAGLVWQSLVGQHIRFPKSWWNGARAPPLGNCPDQSWVYQDCVQIRGDPNLKRQVLNRAAPGRMILHIVVQDFFSSRALQDICVGAFHPNARGVRRTAHPDAMAEGCRNVWLAVRKRDDEVSDLDTMLTTREGAVWESPTCPLLGFPKPKITNANVRAVFGELPPVETIFVPEPELYERLAEMPNTSAAMVLLNEFVFA